MRAERTARRRVDIVKVLVRDDTGAVDAVWFNQKYLTRVLSEGMRLSLRGTFRPQGGRQQFVVKGHEILEEQEGEGVHTEGVVPVYPASEQVSAKLLRALVHQLAPVMRRLPDPLPAHLLAREGLPGTGGRGHRRAPAALARRGTHGARAAGARGAAAHAGRPAAAQARAAVPRAGAGAAGARRARARVPRRAPVRADGAPAGGARRARGRPHAGAADAPPAAGRRGLRQDGRRPLLPGARRGGRPPGRAARADGDAGGAARRDGGAAGRPARVRRARHRVAHRPGAQGGARAHRVRRDAAGDRDARAPAGRRALREPRAARGGRAAPVRRGAARRAGAACRARAAARRTCST